MLVNEKYRIQYLEKRIIGKIWVCKIIVQQKTNWICEIFRKEIMKKRNQSWKMVKVREYLMSVSKFGCCY